MNITNPLQPRTLELLEILQEECAEVIQAVSKIKRFGIESYHPQDPDKVTNIKHLVTELGDVLGMIDMLTVSELENEGMTWHWLDNASKKKKVKVLGFLNT